MLAPGLTINFNLLNYFYTVSWVVKKNAGISWNTIIEATIFCVLDNISRLGCLGGLFVSSLKSLRMWACLCGLANVLTIGLA